MFANFSTACSKWCLAFLFVSAGAGLEAPVTVVAFDISVTQLGFLRLFPPADCPLVGSSNSLLSVMAMPFTDELPRLKGALKV
ncbi:hypothetical protein [uncultured Arthrobacter sp.]|uniref:hypothetical protein n=1 Tax=uncultured Arthrobacter sp. TaxID=114050 RepID=UPI0028D73DB3|nr:hypothetical protein [uncultured Arthrobacter sp.]